MKKHIYFLIIAMVILAACSSPKANEVEEEQNEIPLTESPVSEDWDGHYRWKSGKLVYKMNLPGAAASAAQAQMTMYFDNHGEKKVFETKSTLSFAGTSMNMSMRSLSKDGYSYSWKLGDKTGTKVKTGDISPEDLDFRSLTKEIREKYKMRDEKSETVKGKRCNVYSYEAEIGKGKIYIWDNLMLKAEMTKEGQSTILEVDEIVENPEMDAAIFELPTDVVFTEQMRK